MATARETLQRARARGVPMTLVADRTKLGRYTGPAYPFRNTVYGTMGPKTDVEVLFTSMVNILTTPKGTLPYDPNFGSEIPNLVFEPNDEVTRSLIRHFVVKDLGEQEPRVIVQGVHTDVDERQDPNRVNITVSWTVVGDPNGQVFSGPVGFRLTAA
jgi:phage baseplate assembly protein W